MSEAQPDAVNDLRARVASAEADLRKLVDSVDPSAKAEAKKAADEVLKEELPTPEEQAKADAAQEKASNDYAKTGESKYTAKTQPRDAQGKFRLVLARLKQNLGTSGNQGVIDKIEEAENFDDAGDYAGAVKSASELIETVDRLDSGALNAKSVESVRETTSQLGTVIANLPLPFENQAQKVRYSDLPPALKALTESLITRVEEKIGKEDADKATADLRGFMSGSDVFSQAEVSAQLNRMLRLLT